MPFEIVHFRGSEKILKEKRLVKDIKVTLEYIDDVLYGTIYRRELLRQSLEEKTFSAPFLKWPNVSQTLITQ